MWETRTSSRSYQPMRGLAPTERVQGVSSFGQLSRPLFKSYSRLGRLLPPLTHTQTQTQTHQHIWNWFVFLFWLIDKEKQTQFQQQRQFTRFATCNLQFFRAPKCKQFTTQPAASQCWIMYKAVAKLILEQNTRWQTLQRPLSTHKPHTVTPSNVSTRRLIYLNRLELNPYLYNTTYLRYTYILVFSTTCTLSVLQRCYSKRIKAQVTVCDATRTIQLFENQDSNYFYSILTKYMFQWTLSPTHAYKRSDSYCGRGFNLTYITLRFWSDGWPNSLICFGLLSTNSSLNIKSIYKYMYCIHVHIFAYMRMKQKAYKSSRTRVLRILYRSFLVMCRKWSTGCHICLWSLHSASWSSLPWDPAPYPGW